MAAAYASVKHELRTYYLSCCREEETEVKIDGDTSEEIAATSEWAHKRPPPQGERRRHEASNPTSESRPSPPRVSDRQLASLDLLVSHFDSPESPVRPLGAVSLDHNTCLTSMGIILTYIIVLVQFKMSE